MSFESVQTSGKFLLFVLFFFVCLEEKDCRLVGATLIAKVAKVDRCLYLTEEKPPGLTKVLKTITNKYHMKVHGVALH